MNSFQELNASLKASGAQWVADETTLSKLTQAEKARRLGVVINRAALAKAMAPRAQVEIPKFDREVDWRNRNGNKVTPIKDQGGCGSCTSFSTVGAIESIALIELGRTLNLSEADLHFCSSHGATCDGWWPDAAYESVRTRGVTDEANFPYTNAFNGSNPVCNVSTNRESQVVRITASTTLQSAVARKNWLTQVGPCVAAFRVFDDFFSYRSGVYHHVSGSEIGLHNVVIIGYSEDEQCWICKNSWGAGWGMQGFFKIAYGEAGIDTEFPFWTAKGVVLPRLWHGYIGVWEKLSGGTWVARHGLSGQQYQAVFDDLVPKGYRPTVLSGYTINGQERYLCMFEQKGSGGWVARHGLSGQQYQAVFDDLVPKGYRPTILNGYTINGQERYLCMFEQKGGGIWVARHGLSGQQYQALFDGLVPKGYRPTILSGYTVNGQDRYLCMFEQKGGGAWVARHGLSSQQYQAVFDDLVPKGYRPVILDGYTINEQDRYLCMLEQKSGGEWVARHALTDVQYQALFDDLVPKGYRSTILCGYGVSS